MQKIVAMIFAIVLVAVLSVKGTLAYLQDQDSDVNTMTLGNVSIKQHEYERIVNEDGSYEMIKTPRGTGYKIQEYTQAKPLYPGVGQLTNAKYYIYFDQIDVNHAAGGYLASNKPNNIQDKLVLVQNTGTTDVYVRTIFAYELGSFAKSDWKMIIQDGRNQRQWKWLDKEVATINGHNYYIAVATYMGATDGSRHKGGILPPGDYTYNSLGQIYMVSTATNEDCAEIDGNGNGLYDILVLSQAVQADGFKGLMSTSYKDAVNALDTAFGVVNSENVQRWFEGS